MRRRIITAVLLLTLVLSTGTGLLSAQEAATPTPEAAAEATPEATAEATPEAILEDITYTVVSGDRLIKIAERFGVTVTCLARANRIVNPNLIYIGQKLVITVSCQGGGGGEEDTTSEDTAARVCAFDRNPGRIVRDGIYIVQVGDSLDFIACDLGISLACLLESNPQITNRGLIRAGDRLTISPACPAWEGPM
ncbi:MAG: LysM peptidoglycan-binding domain-containing protein [Chloroflexi bacterium]|nr:LysM peptidoglycan-binding domain-containing protein [Chloroflexota bacterium]